MITTTDQAGTPPQQNFGKGKDGRKPAGSKTLQLFLPMPLYFHVQAQAALSHLDVRQYVGRFLEEAFPLPPSDQATLSLPSTCPPDGAGRDSSSR
jgi:hypothetical protein